MECNSKMEKVGFEEKDGGGGERKWETNGRSLGVSFLSTKKLEGNEVNEMNRWENKIKLKIKNKIDK